MQHLIRGDVIENEAHGLRGVQAGWHRNQLVLRDADEFRVCTADRECGNDLTRADSRNGVAEPIHHADKIPTWRKGQLRRLRMNTLTHHHIG